MPSRISVIAATQKKIDALSHAIVDKKNTITGISAIRVTVNNVETVMRFSCTGTRRKR